MKIKSNTLKGLLLHLTLVFGVLMLLSFTFFYKVLPAFTNQDQIVTVPDIYGMRFDEAVEFLKQKDLGFEVMDSSYNADLPPLTVLKQFPKSLAKVKANRKIGLTLNVKIPPAVSYPDLDGVTLDFAKKQFESLGLKIGTIQYKPDIAQNIILESLINGKKVDGGQEITRGATIDLIISEETNRQTY